MKQFVMSVLTVVFVCVCAISAHAEQRVKPLSIDDLIMDDDHVPDDGASPPPPAKPESSPLEVPAPDANDSAPSSDPPSAGSLPSGSDEIVSPEGQQDNMVTKPRLPKDGSAVLSRIATIALEDIPSDETGESQQIARGVGKHQWLVATFENNDREIFLTPRRLVRCQLLEKIEKIIAVNPDARFVVSGVSTVFDGRVYLLINSSFVLEDHLVETSVDSGHRVRKGNTAETKPGRGHEVDEFISDILQDRPGTALLETDMKGRDPENMSNINIKTTGIPAEQNSSVISDRVIRVVLDAESNWYVASFIGDNTLLEAPLRIHPSIQLRNAVRYNTQTGRRIYTRNYTVSGVITEYKGHQYFYITKLMRERNLGRF